MKIHNEKFEGITVDKFLDCKQDIDINGVDAEGVTLKSVKLSYFENGSLHVADSKITNSKILKCQFGNQATFDDIVVNDCVFTETKINDVYSFNNIEINNSKNKDCQWSMFKANDCQIIANVFENQESRFVDMNNCVLKDLQITNGTYDRMKYCNCKFTNVCFDSLRIYEESISDCEFANVSYSNVKFDKCKYNNVDLSEVVFENCQFVNCEFENCKMTDEQKVMFGVVVMLDSMTVDEIAKRFKDYTSAKKYSEILELSSKLIEDKWDYRITVFVLDAMNELEMYEDALKLAKEKKTLCKDHMLAWNRAVAKAYCGIGEYKESLKYILAAYECTESEKFDKHDINRLGFIVTDIKNNTDDNIEPELKELQLKEATKRKDIDNLLHNMRQEELRQMREKVNEISEEDILKGNWELSTILDDLEKHVDCGSTLANFMETGAKYTDAQLKIYALYMYDWQVASEGGHIDFYDAEGAVSSVVYDALIMIGADECAENLKKTYELFPNGIVPDDYMERSDAISELSGFDGWDKEELFDDEEEFEEEVYPFEEFDEFYIKERDEVIEKIYDYIIKHASEFVIKG